MTELEGTPEPMPPEGPRTEAGKAMHEAIMYPDKHRGERKPIGLWIADIEREAASPASLDVEPIREVLAAAAGLDPVNVSVGIVRDLAQVQYDRLTEYARLTPEPESVFNMPDGWNDT